jgi:hypothetical protein
VLDDEPEIEDRKLVGFVPCQRCGRRARVYADDRRALGSWRSECPDGHVAELMPDAWKDRLEK